MIYLNVGGTYFVTTDKTSNKIPYLKAILDKKTAVVLDNLGNIFIDRDPKLFEIILKCVRCGTINFLLKASDKEEIKQEALFYGVTQVHDPYGYKFRRLNQSNASNYYDSDSC